MAAELFEAFLASDDTLRIFVPGTHGRERVMAQLERRLRRYPTEEKRPPLFGVPVGVLMHVAIGTSLATIVTTSISSILAHQKRGAIDWRVFRIITPGILLGALIGSYVAKLI